MFGHISTVLVRVVIATSLALAIIATGTGGALAQGTPAPDSTLITFSADIAVEGQGATVSENVVTVSDAGVYTVSGATEDGMIVINAPGQDVELVLSGASITNPEGPAILISAASNAMITLATGTANVVTDGGVSEFDAAIYGATSWTIGGDGSLEVHAVDEGLSSTEHLTINSGTIHIFSYEDAINANQDGVSVITINDGYLYIETEIGDGIDSNGDLTINGGTVIAHGALADMNGGIDADGVVTFNDGTVIATGTRVSAPVQDSVQKSILVSFGTTLAAGTLITVQDASGGDLLVFAPAIDTQVLLFSSAELADGVSYSVYTGGTPAGESIDGIYTATPLEVGQLADTVTTESANRQMGPGGGPPGA